MGLGSVIGSVEVGKQADLIAFDMSGFDVSPMHDVASHVVNVLDRRQVSDVWVGGRRRVANGDLIDLDPTELRRIAHDWQERIGGS